MKFFLKATKDLSDRQQTIKKYLLVNDQSVEVSNDYSQVRVQGSSEATSPLRKQGNLYVIDRENESLTQATRTAARYDKEKAIRDRAWIKHAYLQGTVPQNKLDGDTDTKSDTLKTANKEKSKQQETDVITKRLTMSMRSRSPDSNSQSAANYFKEEPSAVDSSTMLTSRASKELQKCDSGSEVEAADPKPKAAENKEAKVHNRSVKKVIKLEYPHQLSHKNSGEVEMPLEHHHSAQGRKDKSKSALTFKLDDTSNKAATYTKQDKRVKSKVELGENPTTRRELATPIVAIEITGERELATSPPIESSDTARTKNSVEESKNEVHSTT